MSEQDLRDFLKPRKKKKSDDSYNKKRRSQRDELKSRQKKLDDESRATSLREQKWHQAARSRSFSEAEKEKGRKDLFESFESRLETKPAKSSFRIGVEHVGKEAKNRLFTTSKREKAKSKAVQRKIWKKLI